MGAGWGEEMRGDERLIVLEGIEHTRDRLIGLGRERDGSAVSFPIDEAMLLGIARTVALREGVAIWVSASTLAPRRAGPTSGSLGADAITEIDPWQVEIGGLVEKPLKLDARELIEMRRADLRVAVRREDVPRRLLHPVPGVDLRREQVVHALHAHQFLGFGLFGVLCHLGGQALAVPKRFSM